MILIPTWSSRLWAGLRDNNSLPKKETITETRSRENSLHQGSAVTVPRKKDSMTHRSKFNRTPPGSTRPLMHPKYALKDSNWNVRTLCRSGHIALVDYNKRDEEKSYTHHEHQRNTLDWIKKSATCKTWRHQYLLSLEEMKTTTDKE